MDKIKKIYGLNWYIESPKDKDLKEAYKNSYYHTDFEKECILCHSKFKHGKYNLKICGCCKIFIKCKECNKFYQLFLENLSGTARNSIFNDIENNLEIKGFCSKNCKAKGIYKIQKENKTGWCSEESIRKKNSPYFNSIRSQNATKNGTKAKAVQTQIEKGLHPTQNLSLQTKKVMLMNLRKSGINVTLEDLMNKNQEEIIRYLIKIPLKINGEIVKYLNSQIYNKRCGSIGLTGICKEDGIRYALNT